LVQSSDLNPEPQLYYDKENAPFNPKQATVLNP